MSALSSVDFIMPLSQAQKGYDSSKFLLMLRQYFFIITISQSDPTFVCFVELLVIIRTYVS